MSRSKFMTIGELVAEGITTNQPVTEWHKTAIVHTKNLKGFYLVSGIINNGKISAKMHLVASESLNRTYERPSYDACVPISDLKQISYSDVAKLISKRQLQQNMNLHKLKAMIENDPPN